MPTILTPLGQRRPNIPIDKELTEYLWKAQLKHAKEQIEYAIQYTNNVSDDGYDYLRGSLILAQWMTEIWFDHDAERLNKLLNSHRDESDLSNIATDGIASAFYELDPRALDLDEDELTT